MIAAVYGAFFHVLSEENQILLAKPIGKLRVKKKETRHSICIGDEVEYRLNSQQDSTDIQAVITNVLPRKNFVGRSDLYKTQVLASNVDLVAVVLSLFHPTANFGFLDRVLAECEMRNIEAIIIINKYDLLKDKKISVLISDKYLDELNNRIKEYKQLKYEVLLTSFVEAISNKLYNKISGKTVLLTGLSGVGKSTFLNKFAGKKIQQVDEDIIKFKGRHITTNPVLYVSSDNTRLIDTPGLREFGLYHWTPLELQNGFVELHGIQCQFNDCLHVNAPNCGIKESKISQKRYDSYCSILNALKEKYKPRRGNSYR